MAAERGRPRPAPAGPGRDDVSLRRAVIAGRPVDGRGTFQVVDPSTGEPLARVARCGAGEVDHAVEAARRAFDAGWRDTSAADRAAACRAMADELRAHRAELARLETLDTGKPLAQGGADVDAAARYFTFYAGCVEALSGDSLICSPELLAYTLLEPYGVCVHIVPWNYPMQVTARTIAPALAAGNTCVLKPAEDAPLTGIRIGELAVEAGIPDGVLNVVPGYGAEAGAALAAHPGIDHLSFTGSREIGTSVMRAAAGNIVPVTLELGGKSPHVLLPDADVDLAVATIVSSVTEHAGQNCSAGSRLLVHETVHDRVVAMIADAFAALRIGRGIDDLDLGPLISRRQRERVLGYIEQGRRVGRLVTGGSIPGAPVPAGGFFVQPTLFDEVPPDCAVAQEEIFGPVLSVIAFRKVAEAVAVANGTSYGLSAGVWTRDVGLAHHLIRELRVGQVFVNNYSAAGAVELPFGGYRRSGFGREKGAEALREYSQCKAVAVRAATMPDDDPPSNPPMWL